MPSYVKPSAQIFQEFRSLPNSVIENLPACIVAPNYHLFRYGVASEKALIGIGAYDPAADVDVDYPSLPAGGVVDLTYVKLYFEDVWAEYAALASSATNPVYVVSDVAPNKLRAAPRIGSAEEGKYGTASASVSTNGVFLQAGGFYVGGVALPEAYYLWPTGGAVKSAISALNNYASQGAQDASMTYRTTEGHTGTFTLLATDSVLTAGTKVQGPHGIVLDFDAVDHDTDRNASARTAARISYTSSTSQPTAANFLTIAGATFEFRATGSGSHDHDVTIGATRRETFQNLKEAIEKAIQAGTGDTDTKLLEVLHIHGSDTSTGHLLIIGNSTFASGNVAATTYTGTAPTLVQPAAHNSLLAPKIVTFSGGVSSFTMSIKPSKMQEVIDASVDSGKLLTLRLNMDGSSTASASWSAANYRVTITGDIGHSTLSEIREALAEDSDIAGLFDLSVIEGDADSTLTLVADQTGAQLTDDVDLVLMRDFYRIKVFANDFVFKTNDAAAVSSHFRSRGVAVGDRVRYQFTGQDSEVYEGETTVRAIEADTTIAALDTADAGDANQDTQAGSTIAHGTGLDIIEAGVDNQRSFSGTATRVFTLHDTETYPGRYTDGVLSETYTIKITVTGTAGAARCSVTAENAGTVRTAVRVEAHPNGSTTDAVVYLSDGLYAVLSPGSGDSDAEFQVGDTYTFSTPVASAYTAIDPATITVSGAYVGTRDTVYRIEVLRGGVFNREAVVMDGVQSANKAVIAYTGQPAAGQTITLGDIVVEWDADVTIGSDADESYTDLVAFINEANLRAYAVIDTDAGTVTIQGATAAVEAVAIDDTANATLTTSTAALSAALDWTVGDVDDEYVLRCTQAGTLTNAAFSLTSLRGDDAATVQFSGSGVSQRVGNSGLSLAVTVDGSPVFAVGDSYVVRVFGARPEVTITDSSGVDQRTTVTVNDGEAIALGVLGGYVTFEDNSNTHGGVTTTGGLLKGDVFYVAATASGAGPNKVIVLKDPLPSGELVFGRTVNNQDNEATADDWTYNYSPTRVAVWLYLSQASTRVTSKRVQESGAYNFEASAGSVAINSDIAVQDPSWVDGNGDMPWLPVYKAAGFLEYRALLAGDDLYSLSDAGDVASALGTVHPDNPLAQGVYTALLNSAAQPVRYFAVSSDDAAGYAAAFDRLAKSSKVYGIAVMSRDSSIIDLLQAHVSALSTETTRRWRIGIVCADVAASVAVVDATTNANADWLGTITRHVSDAADVFRLLTLTNGTPNMLSTVAVGDTVRYAFGTDAWGDPEYAEGVVEDVLTNSTLLLATGPSSPISAAAKVEVYHTRTDGEMATAIAAKSASFDDYRVYNLPPFMLYNEGVAYSGVFGAAALAGLISAVPPQQGLTNSAVVGFDSVPDAFQRFSDLHLNEMAASGTLIVAQDERDGPVYVRHQLSTKARDANVLTAELSVIKNLDAISAYFRDLLSPYIGQYNVTNEMLVVLQTHIQHGLNFIGSARTAVGNLSPMLVLDNEKTRIVSIEQHPTHRDWIIIRVELEMPLPVNVIQLHLVAG